MATGQNVQLFSLRIMFCERRCAFGQGLPTKTCERKLAALLWDRQVSCGVSNWRIILKDWIAIVPDLKGDGQPQFVLAKHVGDRETLRPCREIVEAILNGTPAPLVIPSPIPRPDRHAA